MPAACVAARPNRPNHLPRGEPQQLADCRRCAEHARRRRDVPTGLVVRRIHGIADSRFHLEPEDESVHEVAAGDRVRARVRKQCRGYRDARMNVVLRQRVVVLVHVRADAVQERRVERIELLAPADHDGGSLARERRKRRDRDVDSGLDAAAERTAQVVQDCAFRLAPHVVRNGVEIAFGHVGGQGLRDGHFSPFARSFRFFRSQAAKRTQLIGGRKAESCCQLSPWFSLSHRLPVVLPKASVSPAASMSSPWRYTTS